jgi:hypothetical protein
MFNLVKLNPAFFERDVICCPDDQKIQNLNIQKLSGLDEGARHGNIIRAGGWVTAGMVVNHIDGSRVAPDGGFKQLCFPMRLWWFFFTPACP